MRQGYWIAGGALACVAAALGAQAVRRPATPVRPAPPPLAAMTPALPATQALFDGYVAAGKMPGIVGAFGVGDAPTRFVAAGRIANDAGAPRAGPDSLWRIYSMTKPITAMAAMVLIDEGKIALDDPVARYLPAFARMRVLTDADTSLASRPAARPITIRHLLTHTAGLGYSIVTKGPLLKEYERLGITPGQFNAKVEALARQRRPATLAAFADRVATLPLIADPGTRWSYSIGLDVMGRVIEVAGGAPFDAFVQAKLLSPLRMNSTFWQVPAADARRLSTSYTFVGDLRVPTDPGASSVYLARPSFPYGGAGLVSSARDYDRFLHMLANGGTLDGVRVLKPQTVRLAMSNLLPAGVAFRGVDANTGGARGGVEQGFGAGGSVYLADGPGGFPARGTYGWGGAAGTIAWVDPVHRIRGTVMVNYFPAGRYPLRQEVARALGKDAQSLMR